MHVDVHFVAGHFGEGTPRLLDRLAEGVGGARVARVLGIADDPAPPSGSGVHEVLSWLAEVPQGRTRAARLQLELQGGRELTAWCEAWAAPPVGTVLLGLRLELPAGQGLEQARGLEVALLGISCAALAREAQGAVLIGQELGSVAVGSPEGTVGEQVRGRVRDAAIPPELVVCTADTRGGLGELEGYAESPLGDLFELRRR